MGANAIRFILLLLLSLLIGTMFGIWLGFNPASLSAAAYVEQQQNAIRSLNTLLPVMGAVCILLAVRETQASPSNMEELDAREGHSRTPATLPAHSRSLSLRM
jgi:hypothetical protein